MSKQKLNCWEVTKCERQPGGSRTEEFGICPISMNDEFDGVHDGEKAGRACWVVAQSYSQKDTKRDFTQKFSDCKACNFFQQVNREESDSIMGFAATPTGMRIWLKNRKKME